MRLTLEDTNRKINDPIPQNPNLTIEETQVEPIEKPQIQKVETPVQEEVTKVSDIDKYFSNNDIPVKDKFDLEEQGMSLTLQSMYPEMDEVERNEWQISMEYLAEKYDTSFTDIMSNWNNVATNFTGKPTASIKEVFKTIANVENPATTIGDRAIYPSEAELFAEYAVEEVVETGKQFGKETVNQGVSGFAGLLNWAISATGASMDRGYDATNVEGMGYQMVHKMQNPKEDTVKFVERAQLEVAKTLKKIQLDPNEWWIKNVVNNPSFGNDIRQMGIAVGAQAGLMVSQGIVFKTFGAIPKLMGMVGKSERVASFACSIFGMTEFIGAVNKNATMIEAKERGYTDQQAVIAGKYAKESQKGVTALEQTLEFAGFALKSKLGKFGKPFAYILAMYGNSEGELLENEKQEQGLEFALGNKVNSLPIWYPRTWKAFTSGTEEERFTAGVALFSGLFYDGIIAQPMARSKAEGARQVTEIKNDWDFKFGKSSREGLTDVEVVTLYKDKNEDYMDTKGKETIQYYKTKEKLDSLVSDINEGKVDKEVGDYILTILEDPKALYKELGLDSDVKVLEYLNKNSEMLKQQVKGAYKTLGRSANFMGAKDVINSAQNIYTASMRGLQILSNSKDRRDWNKRMRTEFGDGVNPYLNKLYANANKLTESKLINQELVVKALDQAINNKFPNKVPRKIKEMVRDYERVQDIDISKIKNLPEGVLIDNEIPMREVRKKKRPATPAEIKRGKKQDLKKNFIRLKGRPSSIPSTLTDVSKVNKKLTTSLKRMLKANVGQGALDIYGEELDRLGNLDLRVKDLEQSDIDSLNEIVGSYKAAIDSEFMKNRQANAKEIKEQVTKLDKQQNDIYNKNNKIETGMPLEPGMQKKIGSFTKNSMTYMQRAVNNPWLLLKRLDGGIKGVMYNLLAEGARNSDMRKAKFEVALLNIRDKYYGINDSKLKRKNWDKTDININLNGKETNLSKQQLLTIYLTAKQEDGRRHLLGGKNKTQSNKESSGNFTMTEDDIETINNMVENDKELSNAADYIRDSFETIATFINEVSIEDSGFNLATIEDYFPLIVNQEELNFITSDSFNEEGDITKGLDSYFKPFRNMFETRGMPFKKRNNTSTKGLNILSAEQTLERVKNKALKYYAHKQQVEKTLSILTSNVEGKVSAKDAIEKNWGKSTYRAIIKLAEEPLVNKNHSYEDAWYQKVTSHIAQVRLLSSIAVPLYQYVSMAQAATRMDSKYAAIAVANVAKNSVQHLNAKFEQYKDVNPLLYMRYREARSSYALGEGLATESIRAIDTGKRVLSAPMKHADNATVMAIFEACIQEVDDTTNLKGQARWDAVNAKFMPILGETQPYFSKTGRGEWARSNNIFFRNLMIFSSATSQVSSLLLDACYSKDPKYQTKVFTATIANVVMVALIKTGLKEGYKYLKEEELDTKSQEGFLEDLMWNIIMTGGTSFLTPVGGKVLTGFQYGNLAEIPILGTGEDSIKLVKQIAKALSISNGRKRSKALKKLTFDIIKFTGSNITGGGDLGAYSFLLASKAVKRKPKYESIFNY